MRTITENGIEYLVSGDYPDGAFCKQVAYKGEPVVEEKVTKAMTGVLSKDPVGQVVLMILRKLGMVEG
jgi:hypothetical protein